MEYLVKIIGRLVESTRPYKLVWNTEVEKFDKIYELPERIMQVYTVKTGDKKELSQFIEHHTIPIIQMQGMLAKDDPTQDDMTQFKADRKWIPMHMIAYLVAEVTELTGSSPVLDENGKLRTEDGKEIVLQ